MGGARKWYQPQDTEPHSSDSGCCSRGQLHISMPTRQAVSVIILPEKLTLTLAFM